MVRRVSHTPPTLSPATQAWLLWVARASLARALGTTPPPKPARPDDPLLSAKTRAFVSWHEGRRLVGCIGTLAATEPLETTVEKYAVESGLRDPRLPPATAEQLPRLSCEVSVLTDPVDMDEVGLPAITAALVPGRDGLVLRDDGRRAVFLPVVWESVPTPELFVAALCRKAGIDPATRGSHVRGQRFFAVKVADPAPPE